MELKLEKGVLHEVRFHVLIVPLWNWNPESQVQLKADDSSNRTFMELKLISSRYNRTYTGF